MRSRSRSGPVDAAEVGRTRRAGQWSSDMPPRTSRSEESSSDGGWSQMSTRPGSDTCSTDGAVGSPTHRLSYARIADTCTHPATDKLPDIAGRLPPWQSRTETGGAFWGMTVGARLHTTYWGLLKQPDNQKLTNPLQQRPITTTTAPDARFFLARKMESHEQGAKGIAV